MGVVPPRVWDWEVPLPLPAPRWPLKGESLVGAMAHNCWFVGFGLCQVPLITYNWSVRHGGCLRDRRSHPEGGCSYTRPLATLLMWGAVIGRVSSPAPRRGPRRDGTRVGAAGLAPWVGAVGRYSEENL